MRNKLKLLIGLCLFSMALFTYSAVSDWRDYLPPNSRTEEGTGLWNTILNLFVQKAGDSMTDNLTFSTINKDIVPKSGSASAQGFAGKIAFQTGVLDTISNSLVTAKTLCFITKADSTVPLANTYICTNQIGVGIKIIPATVCTNSLNFRLVETN